MEEHFQGMGAYIPYAVLYDTRLTHRQKVMYAMIHNLCNSRGYCWASNAWFAEKLDSSERRVREDVANLSKCGYIVTAMEVTDKGTQRIIKETHLSKGGVPENGHTPLAKNDHTLMAKNGHRNNISINSNLMSVSLDSEDRPPSKGKISLAVQTLGISKTAGKTISSGEVEFAVTASLAYGRIRKSYLPNSRNLTWKGKDYGQIIVLMREGLTLDQVETMFFNMFNESYHKETKWKYLTPEFVGRPTKVNMYANNI